MKIAQKCLTCYYAARDPNANPEVDAQSGIQAMCLRTPPTAHLVFDSKGVMSNATVYPIVNAGSISCSDFASEHGVQGG